MSALRVAFAGTPDFAVPALEALLRSGHRVVGVLTQPDRPKGRGRQIAASPVKTAALAHGIPVSQPQSLKAEADRVELAAWRPDVLVVVAYGLILPRAVLALPRFGCINIHASLLPRWRGAAPIQRAILAGDTETGVTIMLMDVGLDTGPMLLQERVPITASDTGGSLHDRLAALGASALLEGLDKHAAGTLAAVPQPSEGVTYAAKIEKAEALIDWTRDARAIERQIRAFNPWPIAETRLDGEQLRVFAAAVDGPLQEQPDELAEITAELPELTEELPELTAEFPDGLPPELSAELPVARPDVREVATDQGSRGPEPGTIVAVRDNAILVACGRGQLGLQLVQRPGRRAVAAKDFAHGVQLIGRRLG
ncbi:MAG: Methionyl-tRNA formyltransferase [Gammaproteobacteria bacterium]|nr:Methionyl-tRNA formyltransferase [Gammaproteobacteria bacterium]